MKVSTVSNLLTAAATAALLSIAIGATGCGPQQSGTASEQMHEAGESAESAASSSGHMVTHAVEGAGIAISDTDITAKVKMALNESAVHVTTSGGIVTLTGSVPSEADSTHARDVASRVAGVKDVENHLIVRK